MKELTEPEALCKAAAYCSAAEHCRAEVNDKLHAWGVADAGTRERILQRLTAERYIDEARYARFFVRDKYRFNKWGRTKIALALQQKRIPPALCQEAFNEVDEAEYLQILRELLSAKARSTRARNDYERNGKLVRFAMGRGYEPDAIRRCLPAATDDDYGLD